MTRGHGIERRDSTAGISCPLWLCRDPWADNLNVSGFGDKLSSTHLLLLVGMQVSVLSVTTGIGLGLF